MKRLMLVMLAVLFAIASGNVLAEEAENKIGVGVTTDYYSKYIWRGQQLNDDPVLQQAVDVTYGKLTATLWGSFDLTNYNGHSGLYEVDYVLDYSDDVPGVEGLGYSVGLAYYTFPSSFIKDTTELYAGLNLDCPLNPSIKINRDVDEAGGSYVALAVSHSIEKIAELSEDMPVGLELGAGVGWGSASYNKYYWGSDHHKFNDATLSLAFPIQVKDSGWTLTPSLNYATILGSLRDTDAYGSDSDFFFVGLSLHKAF